ncbi:hypothetical protein [Streptomyces sp. x-19]|uniref:hypothetical protein n=1 Tax=Streptomyces sp. x-19 TaxID=2789280 RepID=UPI003980BC13
MFGQVGNHAERRKCGIAASVLAGVTLFATACAGGTENSDNGSTAKSSHASGKGKEVDAAYKYRQFLRDNGAKVEEPKDEKHAMAIDGDAEMVKKAMKACADVDGGSGREEISQADKDKLLKYAQCMRKNGVDMKDPEFADGGARSEASTVPQGAEIEKHEKANKACRNQIGE